MNVVVFCFCLVLMILGISELCRLIVFRVTKPLTRGGLTVVVQPKTADECEMMLRAAVERIQFLDFSGPCEILCRPAGDDPEIGRLCRLFAVHYPSVHVVNELLNKEDPKQLGDACGTTKAL